MRASGRPRRLMAAEFLTVPVSRRWPAGRGAADAARPWPISAKAFRADATRRAVGFPPARTFRARQPARPRIQEARTDAPCSALQQRDPHGSPQLSHAHGVSLPPDRARQERGGAVLRGATAQRSQLLAAAAPVREPRPPGSTDRLRVGLPRHTRRAALRHVSRVVPRRPATVRHGGGRSGRCRRAPSQTPRERRWRHGRRR